MNKNNAVRRWLVMAGLAVAAAAGAVHAKDSAALSRMWLAEVTPAQDQAFREGIKTYIGCLHQHGAKQTVWAWSAQTGDVGRYVFEVGAGTWAGLDFVDPADKDCDPVFNANVLPHSGKWVSWVAERMPKLSHMVMDSKAVPAFVYVYSVRIKPGHGPALMEAMEKYASAARNSKWEGQWLVWQNSGGGRGASDFNLVWPNASWAEIGKQPSPSLKAMMEKAYGKAQAAAIRKQFMDAIAEQWDGVWRASKELSYIPAG